jgi:hypothetical protein
MAIKQKIPGAGVFCIPNHPTIEPKIGTEGAATNLHVASARSSQTALGSTKFLHARSHRVRVNRTHDSADGSKMWPGLHVHWPAEQSALCMPAQSEFVSQRNPDPALPPGIDNRDAATSRRAMPGADSTLAMHQSAIAATAISLTELSILVTGNAVVGLRVFAKK